MYKLLPSTARLQNEKYIDKKPSHAAFSTSQKIAILPFGVNKMKNPELALSLLRALGGFPVSSIKDDEDSNDVVTYRRSLPLVLWSFSVHLLLLLFPVFVALAMLAFSPERFAPLVRAVGDFDGSNMARLGVSLAEQVRDSAATGSNRKFANFFSKSRKIRKENFYYISW